MEELSAGGALSIGFAFAAIITGLMYILERKKEKDKKKGKK